MVCTPGPCAAAVRPLGTAPLPRARVMRNTCRLAVKRRMNVKTTRM